MTSRDFVFWLQGYLELADPDQALKASQVDSIRQHLSLVFKHEIDPSMGPPAHQDALNELHQHPNSPRPPSHLLRC